MLHTVRFLCSVVAAVARLIRELRRRKAIHMASSAAASFPSPAATTPCPVGLISSFTPLAPRRKKAAAVQKQPLAVGPPPALLASGGGDVEEQAEGRRTKKEAWAGRRRPARLVIPVADDAGEVAAGWGAAAAAGKEADVVVKGEGFCVASRAGPRHAMEDAYSVVTHQNDGDPQLAFYGVFDGHGGRAAVDFVSRRLGENVVSAVLAAATHEDEASPAAEEEDAVSAAIRAAYLATDSELLAQHQGVGGGGACAATAVVKGGDLYVAHVGDCRVVLSHGGGRAAALTADHTCAVESERQRIERAGGYVCSSSSGVWRVQGSLAVSRSFGDAGLKQWIVAEAAVTKVALAGAGCEFLVVASDGLWDKVGNQEAIDVVSRNRANGSVELVDLARRRGSRDDVTVMVVDLEWFVR